ncbi:MAG: hypothetical protein AB7O59_03970 [Pirellulales bacterium]
MLVSAPSRLHFGLLSFGHPGQRQFGGAGVMIERPGLHLRLAPAECFAAVGPLADRVERAAVRFARACELAAVPNVRVEVLQAPPEHVGLGTGTQLALAVVAGLNALTRGEPLAPETLAQWSGRGLRSAVGTYGFAHGGLIAEGGKGPSDALAPLTRRIEIPDRWRFVLVLPRAGRGLSGEDEQQAFAALPPVPPSTTAALWEELTERLLPAAERADLAQFGRSLYDYGYQSGMCFAARQGGAFASPRVVEIVELIRKEGVTGVGQSSWGPTVFAVVESAVAAEQLVARIRPHVETDSAVLVTAPNNSGARIDVSET